MQIRCYIDLGYWAYSRRVASLTHSSPSAAVWRAPKPVTTTDNIWHNHQTPPPRLGLSSPLTPLTIVHKRENNRLWRQILQLNDTLRPIGRRVSGEGGNSDRASGYTWASTRPSPSPQSCTIRAITVWKKTQGLQSNNLHTKQISSHGDFDEFETRNIQLLTSTCISFSRWKDSLI